MQNSKNDDPPSYRVAVRLPPLPSTESPPPPYSAVLPETAITTPIIVLRPQTPIDYNRNRCHYLRELWNRLTAHKCSMVLAPLFILLSSISFAALIIGGRERWRCPGNPNVPVWLIVFGVMGIIWCWSTAFLILGRAICDDPYKRRCKRLLIATTILFLTFFIAWSITGLIWTSGLSSGGGSKCDSTVYTYAYGLSITQMIIICIAFGSICG